MYGTISNYVGYMAHAVYNNGCCVPQIIFDTLHNPNEQNPRRRLAKLTMNNVIDDLGMLKEDEGCCIQRFATFCRKENVTYYALDLKHKLFKTNKNDVSKNQNGLPRLVFICANNHLYPITDEEHRQTIFKHLQKLVEV